MNASQIRVGVVGASGYSGEELVRLLLGHPQVELRSVTSRQQAGQRLDQIFPRFAQFPVARQLRFELPDAAALAGDVEVVFLALPHGVAAEFAVPLLEQGVRVIDLSADFRLRKPEVYREFYGHDHPAPQLLDQAVYGLPEAHREAIRSAKLVASPGCYPTSVLLPVLPLLKAGLIEPASIIANSLSGVTGAGRKVELGYLFVECNESLRPYGVPKHRHLSEMEQELSAAAGSSVTIQFIPHLVPMNRGILSTLCLAPRRRFSTTGEAEALEREVADCYRASYEAEPFVRVLEGDRLPDTKNVTGTNMLELAWRLDRRTGRLVVMSALDNLIKGAGGQAVQSFNIQHRFPETTGLI